MNPENGTVVIFTDEDTDGMCATRIIDNAIEKTFPNAKRSIIWQEWDFFGMRKSDFHKIMAENPAVVFILDLGSGAEILSYAATFLQENIQVVILDNHPPDPEVLSSQEYADYKHLLGLLTQNDLFYYESSNRTCTTAIAYLYAKGMGWSVENMEKWAILGIEGDVAHDPEKSPEGYALFTELLKIHPYLSGLIYSKKENDPNSFDWGILSFYAQLLHNPRRMRLNDGPKICYPAMKEMEQIPNWLEFNSIVNKKKLDSPIFYEPSEDLRTKPSKDKNPATKQLLMDTIEFRAKKAGFDKWPEFIQLDYPDFSVTIVSNSWNIASYLASKLGGQNKKTWFVINSMPGYGIHVSGRNGENGTLHIGKVFSKANPAIMEGGGLKPAGSASTHTTNAEAILDELVRCVEASKR